MESVRKHRGIKIVTAKKGTICYSNQIITQQNFSQTFMNKIIYLGLSISEISIIVIYEFWYDKIKPKYNKNPKSCYIDTVVLLSM